MTLARWVGRGAAVVLEPPIRAQVRLVQAVRQARNAKKAWPKQPWTIASDVEMRVTRSPPITPCTITPARASQAAAL